MTDKLYFVSRWVGGEIGVSSSITRVHPLESSNLHHPFCNVISWQELSDDDIKIFEESRKDDPILSSVQTR